MWLVMMVAMMLPSAAPMILLYAAFARGARGAALAPAFVFAGIYVLLWTAFSAVAAMAQMFLVQRAWCRKRRSGWATGALPADCWCWRGFIN